MALLMRKNVCFTCKSILKFNVYTSTKCMDLGPQEKQYYSARSKPQIQKPEIVDKEKDTEDFTNILNYYKDNRILYNCFIERYKMKAPYFIKNKLYNKMIAEEKKKAYNASIPLVVQRLKEKMSENSVSSSCTEIEVTHNESETQHFPFAKFQDINIDNVQKDEKKILEHSFTDVDTPSLKEDIASRLEEYNVKKEKGVFDQIQKGKEEKELEFNIYKDTLLSDLSDENTLEEPFNMHGTPNLKIPKSSVPCGGCGEHLHCQDEGLPGYLPSELFCDKNKGELRNMVCQRCFFLKHHNTALNVRVSPDVYEKALRPISQSRALVIVVMDLMDAPCSIWPGLFDLIGTRRPVVVVGNKVDLLPLDNEDYLNTIKASLVEAIKGTSLWRTNVRHVGLISAKTGFGVEELITHLQINWGVAGDVYIIGCTNAGKSSLFNALLRSDMCQVVASNLIKRATSSPWPGTTLNLLKFPILRPTGKRLFDRMRRITKDKLRREEVVLTGPQKVTPSLVGHIGKTYQLSQNEEETTDPFRVTSDRIAKDFTPIMGINSDKKDFVGCRWCFDTPGTVQPDQFLGLLSHEELLEVLPRERLKPRTFLLYNSQSLFIAGLARMDLLYSPRPVRVTVCCSSSLPITIVATAEASSIYRSYLGSDLLRVPHGPGPRLDLWPPLNPKDVRLQGSGMESAADVVLSSAGFISISGNENADIDLRCWTPGGRGVYTRTPSMLPFAYKMRGKRIRGTQKYNRRTVKMKP